MSDTGWIHPGPISPLDCDEAGCDWRVHGVPDKYHANALARHIAETHQTVEASNAEVTGRAFPIRPLPDDDARFTFGLTSDVAKVLQEHGYPPVTNGRDLLELQQALYRFLYVGPDDEAVS